MNVDEALFWWEERPRWARRSALAALSLLVYAAGCAVGVQPEREAGEQAARSVDQLRSELEDRRRGLRDFTPAEGELEAELARTRAALRPDSALRGADFQSTLLTSVSRAAEDAGVSSPIFNPAGVDTLLAAGPEEGGLLALAVEGQFNAGTRDVTRLLRRLGTTIPAPAFLDTLSVLRALPEHRVYLRLRVLRPFGDTGSGSRGGADAG